MPLKDDIQALRDRTLAELVEAHDYFHDSEPVWRFVAQVNLEEPRIDADNPVTGTKTSPTDINLNA